MVFLVAVSCFLCGLKGCPGRTSKAAFENGPSKDFSGVFRNLCNVFAHVII